MADIFYPYSRHEAQREGELAEWKQSHQANVKCAHDIENLIGSHTRDGQLEPDCARAALDWWGFRRVQFVLSNTLPSADAQGFDTDSLRWVQTAFVPPDKANGEFKIQAGAALLAQFLQQTYAEYHALGMFGTEHRAVGEPDYTGKVLILRPSVLREECWSAQNQLWYGQTGFGLSPTSSGRAVFATCLGDGEKARLNRADFIGALDEQYLPDWAAERLAELRGTTQEQGEPVEEQTDGPAQGGMEIR